MDITLWALVLSLLIPACWSVDVINGAGGDFLYGLSVISDTIHFFSSNVLIYFSANSLFRCIKSLDFNLPEFLSKSLLVAILLFSLEINSDSKSCLSELSVTLIE